MQLHIDEKILCPFLQKEMFYKSCFCSFLFFLCDHFLVQTGPSLICMMLLAWIRWFRNFPSLSQKTFGSVFACRLRSPLRTCVRTHTRFSPLPLSFSPFSWVSCGDLNGAMNIQRILERSRENPSYTWTESSAYTWTEPWTPVVYLNGAANYTWTEPWKINVNYPLVWTKLSLNAILCVFQLWRCCLQKT